MELALLKTPSAKGVERPEDERETVCEKETFKETFSETGVERPLPENERETDKTETLE